ncbi:MAG: Coenzyme F420 hydrogenase/dehydrogenase, beta subunit C-terminal domain [Desulfosalsimonas sp.]
MQVFGPNELMTDVIEAGLCTGCGACVNLCPYFRNYRGKTAMLFPCDRTSGQCHAFCPKIEVDLDWLSRVLFAIPYPAEPAGRFRQMLMARGGRALPEGKFQDGGTVSALIMYALESNMLDAAVLTGRNGMFPAPGIAVRPQEVPGFACSKYTAAPTIASLNEGLNLGYTQMGVVGTPCQLTAVAQMSANPLQVKDFADPVALAIGVFCTWAVDTRGFAGFIQRYASGESIRKMRIPPPPADVLEIEAEDENFEIPLDRLRAFVPEGCMLCPDMTAEWADLSVGSMEGFDNWNTLIVRSRRGERLMRKAVTAGYLEVDDFPEENREHLLDAARAKKRRAFEKAGKEGRLNTREPGRRAALRINPGTLERIISG